MLGKKVKEFSVIFIALCLMLCMNVLPVNAYSNQNMVPTVGPVLPAPPSNFNPLTATDQELQEYGLPTRPSNSVDLAQWTDVMSHAKYYGKPVQTPSNYRLGLGGTEYSKTWAGYVVKSGSNNNITYTQSTADWIQPAFSGSGAPAFWTGIGGDYGSSSIVQAGAISNATFFGAPASYIFVVEDCPLDWEWESNPAVNPGDELYVQVTYGGTVSTAFLLDFKTYQYTTLQFWTPYYDGSSADYIYEAVSQHYCSWGYTNFSVCGYVGSNGAGSLSNSQYTEDIMTDNGKSNGNLEAYPLNVNNSSFIVISQ